MKQYAAWDVKITDFPQNGSIDEIIRFFLRYGILAPSTHNTQPWLFKIKGNKLEVMPDLRYILPGADHHTRNLYISLGCSITNIISAAEFFGFTVKVEYRISGIKNSYVVLSFQKDPEASKTQLASLLPLITRRYSNKFPYLNMPIKSPVLCSLRSGYKYEKIHLLLNNNPNDVKAVAGILYQAVEDLSGNSVFRKELSFWLKPNNTKAYDGIPGFVAGLNPVISHLGRFAIRYFPKSINIISNKDKKLVEESAAFGVIASTENNISTWISVGRLYEEFHLKVTASNLNMAPMHAIVENSKTRQGLAELISLGNKIPHIFFRIGYAKNKIYHTPRRELGAFIC